MQLQNRLSTYLELVPKITMEKVPAAAYMPSGLPYTLNDVVCMTRLGGGKLRLGVVYTDPANQFNSYFSFLDESNGVNRFNMDIPWLYNTSGDNYAAELAAWQNAKVGDPVYMTYTAGTNPSTLNQIFFDKVVVGVDQHNNNIYAQYVTAIEPTENFIQIGTFKSVGQIDLGKRYININFYPDNTPIPLVRNVVQEKNTTSKQSKDKENEVKG